MKQTIIDDYTGDTVEVSGVSCSVCGDSNDVMYRETDNVYCPKCYFAPDRGL